MFQQILAGVIGEFANHFVLMVVEADVAAAAVSYGDVESAKDECGGFVVHGAADDGGEGFHDRVLDGLFVVEDELRLDGGFVGDCDTTRDTFVEVTEVPGFQGWGLARVSGDLDEGAAWGVF